MKTVSIVIPTYNEEENVYPLSCEIIKEFKENIPDYEYEILYLLAKALDRYFRKNKSIHKYGIPLIMEQKIM